MGKGGRKKKLLNELTAYLTWSKVGKIPLCSNNTCIGNNFVANLFRGVQWLSGRVLDLGSKGC